MKLFNKVFIIGCGLIGASMGLNLVTKRLAKQVVGVGRDPSNLRTAKRRRAIHEAWTIRSTKDLFQSDRLLEADLIILATPARTIGTFLEAIPASFIRRMKRGAVITDVGSTKRSIVRIGERRLQGPVSFVGAHPIAGTERSRAAAAEGDLFRDCITIVTKTKKTSRSAQRKVCALWRSIGSRILILSPQEHDRLLAATSHLPHMVAYSLIQALGQNPQVAKLAGGGLRDFTRIASSDPVMWRDICLENREEILKAMNRYEDKWRFLKKAIKRGDPTVIQRFFERGQQTRKRIL